MAFSSSLLTPLQRDILLAIRGTESFFLSGGAALAAGYLGHRKSIDIDLFVVESRELEGVIGTIRAAASEHGWFVETIHAYPGFKRLSVRRGDESTLVDVVHEMVHQEVALPDKPIMDGIRIDDLDDLVANKLCALLGRGDIKDLVDLYFLSGTGVDVLSALPAAFRKDSGMEPAILADVLRQVPTGLEGLMMVRSLDESDLRKYRDGLVSELLEFAWPGDSGRG